MGSFVDLTGRLFGRWTALERAANTDSGQTRFLCRCECGVVKRVTSVSLLNGHSKSCGCLAAEIFPRISVKHGHSPVGKCSGAYSSWEAMRARCNNPNNGSYHNYGGRGIVVCDRWNNFSNFFEDMGDRPEGMSLDRINSDGDYEPCNCRWADRVMQSRNSRACYITPELADAIRLVRMQTDMTFKELGKMFGISKSSARSICRDEVIGLRRGPDNSNST